MENEKPADGKIYWTPDHVWKTTEIFYPNQQIVDLNDLPNEAFILLYRVNNFCLIDAFMQIFYRLAATMGHEIKKWTSFYWMAEEESTPGKPIEDRVSLFEKCFDEETRNALLLYLIFNDKFDHLLREKLKKLKSEKKFSAFYLEHGKIYEKLVEPAKKAVRYWLRSKQLSIEESPQKKNFLADKKIESFLYEAHHKIQKDSWDYMDLKPDELVSIYKNWNIPKKWNPEINLKRPASVPWDKEGILYLSLDFWKWSQYFVPLLNGKVEKMPLKAYNIHHDNWRSFYGLATEDTRERKTERKEKPRRPPDHLDMSGTMAIYGALDKLFEKEGPGDPRKIHPEIYRAFYLTSFEGYKDSKAAKMAGISVSTIEKTRKKIIGLYKK